MKKAELEERLNMVEWSLTKLKEELEMDATEYAKMVTADGMWIPNREMEAEDTYSYRIGVAIAWVDHILKELGKEGD